MIFFLIGNHYHQANPHIHREHIFWATTFLSGLPQPLSSQMGYDFTVHWLFPFSSCHLTVPQAARFSNSPKYPPLSHLQAFTALLTLSATHHVNAHYEWLPAICSNKIRNNFCDFFLIGNHYHQANPHIHRQHIFWATTFLSGLPQPLSSQMAYDFTVHWLFSFSSCHLTG